MGCRETEGLRTCQPGIPEALSRAELTLSLKKEFAEQRKRLDVDIGIT